MLEEERRRMEE